MRQHKHYELIVAKAANMDFVVFEKQNTATHEKEEYKPIQPDGNKAIWFHENARYFLCLPQHKDACLHWLNGGDVLYSEGQSSWEPYTLSPEHPKYPLQDFGWAHCAFRISDEELS